MSHGLPRSKRGFNSSQLTTIIPLSGSRIVTAQPTTASPSGLTTGAGGSVITIGLTTSNFGSLALALPKGVIQIEEAMANLQFTCTDANLSQTYTGAFSIGTVAASANTLTSTAANIIASTSVAAATAGVSPLTSAVSSALSVIVNNADSVSGTGTKIVSSQPSVANGSGVSAATIKTGPGLGLYLNLTTTAPTTASVIVTVTGQIVLTYSVTGNY